jgi:hypothetical protein
MFLLVTETIHKQELLLFANTNGLYHCDEA